MPSCGSPLWPLDVALACELRQWRDTTSSPVYEYITEDNVRGSMRTKCGWDVRRNLLPWTSQVDNDY